MLESNTHDNKPNGTAALSICDDLEVMTMILRNVRNTLIPCVKGQGLSEQDRQQIESQLSRLRQIIDSALGYVPLETRE